MYRTPLQGVGLVWLPARAWEVHEACMRREKRRLRWSPRYAFPEFSPSRRLQHTNATVWIGIGAYAMNFSVSTSMLSRLHRRLLLTHPSLDGLDQTMHGLPSRSRFISMLPLLTLRLCTKKLQGHHGSGQRPKKLSRLLGN